MLVPVFLVLVQRVVMQDMRTDKAKRHALLVLILQRIAARVTKERAMLDIAVLLLTIHAQHAYRASTRMQQETLLARIVQYSSSR